MKILIVGGTSSLGQALKPVLSEFSEVLTAGRTACDITLDLTSPIDNVTIPNDIDVVINTAASAKTNSFNDIFDTENINVLGTLALCELCKRAQVKSLVLISSIFALLVDDSPFYNIYSLSKKQSDEVAQLYSLKFGLSLTIIRPSQFYGPGEIYRKSQPFLFDIMDKAQQGEDVFIYGSNDAKRNFIHIDDVTNIIARIIIKKIEGVYSCVNIENTSYSEIAAAAIEAFDSKSELKFLADKPDIPNNTFKHDDTLFQKIGYYPQISISDGMKMEASYRRRGQ